ncbi:N-acetylglucosamine kinase [Tenacibaculum sp. E3R01]|uniref:N-acetylglucosamine kinase n=1 Tax=Tenacibaculum sp. E3R01 TaxID=2267227 RepID=UPI000DEBADD7|nr:N-acetylglucosamine kinase [Tenacibaculum sp. E3R01]RBW54280.1 N-acetylglucosamine kinase [Tenacibaculum sp. E3R01]
MILIADGGSTKVDWACINENKNELFRAQTQGLNPNVVSANEIYSRIINSEKLNIHANDIKRIYFYGAGCGTETPKKNLIEVLNSIFSKATITVDEDILGAVYASAGKQEAIVSILGTGSNSCYFNGLTTEYSSPSLGYSIMDEASGNYFGKKLLKDFFYKKMPEKITFQFNSDFNLNPDDIKLNLYKKENPNMYLATFAKFLIENKNEKYVRKLVRKGFKKFFHLHIKPYNKPVSVPLFFIGSIAYFFQDILHEIALKNSMLIKNVIQRPIDGLIDYHKENY